MAVKRPKGKRKPTPKAIGRWDDEGGAPSGGRPRPKRPRDLNQWAKRMVDLATGNATEPDPHQGKDPQAVDLGRRGGLKGGKARAKSLSAAKRAAISRKAAKARWSRKPD